MHSLKRSTRWRIFSKLRWSASIYCTVGQFISNLRVLFFGYTLCLLVFIKIVFQGAYLYEVDIFYLFLYSASIYSGIRDSFMSEAIIPSHTLADHKTLWFIV